MSASEWLVAVGTVLLAVCVGALLLALVQVVATLRSLRRTVNALRAETFDLIVACGVLYHMNEPIKLIENMCAHSNAVLIWTHYFDEDVIRANEHLSKKFAPTVETVEFEGRSIELCEQSYLTDPDWKGYAGGMEKNSFWIRRTSIIEAFAACSFDVSVGPEHPNHPHGPAFTFVARRR